MTVQLPATCHKLRHLRLLLLLLLAPAGPVSADACKDEIAAFFNGGVLDPFVRPPRHEATVRIAADGSEALLVEGTWVAVRRSLVRSGGMYFLTYDDEMWLAQTADGPWSKSPSASPPDFEDLVRAQNTQRAANLSETECLGAQEIDGETLTVYRYRTRTDPSPEGSWFGGHFTAGFDPETGQLMRLELREAVSSWAPEPSDVTDITRVFYDSDLTLTKPE